MSLRSSKRQRGDGPSDESSPETPISASEPPSGQVTPVRMNQRKGKELAKLLKKGGVKIKAPGTKWDDIDLSETFLKDLYQQTPPKNAVTSALHRRRVWLLLGFFFGSFLAWLFAEGPLLDQSLLSLADLDYQSFVAPFAELNMTNFPGLATFHELADTMTKKREEFLSGFRGAFDVGREAANQGKTKEDAVILIPGVISSGLESWSTTEEAAPLFRTRLWGTSTMIRALMGNKKAWIKAMTLDPDTGLDGPEQKVRAAQGLDAAASFGFGYWIWNVLIQNLAVLGYDYNDLTLASYDWRLSYYNLEERDKYFSRLKSQVEFNRQVLGKKTALVSHSMGSAVTLYFLKWVEAPDFGNGGPQWCDNHISSWINIGGTLLGVPKSNAALLSGEMKDTVEMPPAAAYILERFFSRAERADLFRSWAGSASMLLKGGSAVWGTEKDGAPDDPENSNLTYAYTYYFRQPGTEEEALTKDTVYPNMTLDDAHLYLLESTPNSFQKMMESNYSVGFERDPMKIEENNEDHRKWVNPLEARLPIAPNMKIYCLYGWGKDTERGYWYQRGPMGKAEIPIEGDDIQCDDSQGCSTMKSPLDLPLGHTNWIDTSINLDTVPKVRNGVLVGEGDGTVSLLSLGAMCVDGWSRELYNPAGIKVVTRELWHRPIALDVRGGAATADHIDILGSTELNEAVLNIVSGNGHLVTQRLYSRIKEYAAKIKW